MVNQLLANEPVGIALISLFPVPVSSWLTISIDPSLLTNPATILVTEVAGQTLLVQETRQPTTKLALERYPAGVYLVQVRTEKTVYTRRILKL